MSHAEELRRYAELLKQDQLNGRKNAFQFPLEHVIASMTNEPLQEQHAGQKPPDADDCLEFWFRSPDRTWQSLCGRAGWMVMSKSKRKQTGFLCMEMN